MFSSVLIFQKIVTSVVWSIFIAATGFMGIHFQRTHQEYRHLLQLEQQQLQKLRQSQQLHQQQQAYLQHLLTDEDFLEYVVKRHMGYVHDDEVLFRFETVQ
jgi:cell division protein FtsB